jgi:hypothetical protein
MRPLRRTGPVVLLAVVAAVSSACTGGPKRATRSQAAPASSSTEATTTTTTTTPPPATYPLTGRPVDDPAKAARPAVTVKIDNIVDARPQAGVDAADVVYEEFTEGITRFVVVFQSGDADAVGPVRSVRPADPTITRPLGGVLAFSGGSPAAVALAAASPLRLVTENDADVMHRRSSRFAPHNLYTSTPELFGKAPPDAKAPPSFADFLPPGRQYGAAGAMPATHLSLAPAPYLSADYDWDAASATWRRTTDGAPHALEGGGQIAPTNVIVQFMPYSVFAADEKVRYPEVVGTGEAWIMAAGTMVKGAWSKPTPEAVTAFTDADGKPVVLPPGQTWVHLLEPGSRATTS